MRIMAVVPAFNEEHCIYEVVAALKTIQPAIDVLVVNDGSSDHTRDQAARAGAQVIDLAFNLGIGGAVQTGYLWALVNKYDAVIQVDGDGQHNPCYVSVLIKALVENEADMVIGSRFIKEMGYKGGLMRKIGIKFLARIVSLICRHPYFDTTSGFRVLNRKALEVFCIHYPSDYPEVESIVYGLKRGLRIKEVPVQMRARQGGRSSITPMKSVYYMLKVTMMLFLQPKEGRG